MRHLRSSFGGLLVVMVLAGCSESDPTAPESLEIAGSWAGSVLLPNGYGTSFNLVQNGSTISGEMRVSGSFPKGLPVTGALDASGRTFTWTVTRGCEIWGGVLNVHPNELEMAGPIVINRIGCRPAQSNGGGRLTVSKR
jgi:hypothetical protein